MPVAMKPELLAELMKLAKDPKDLFGPEGVLQQLKGALMERMLEAELTEHLGHEPNEARGARAAIAATGTRRRR